MKRSIILTIVIISAISVFAQSLSINSPTYLGLLLIDETNVDKMAEICRYYQLNEQNEEENFYVFTHKDGTKIRFKVDETNLGNIPEVQILLKEKSGTIKKILSEAGYEKQGSFFYKGTKFEHRRTKCQISSGSPSILTFTKEYKVEE